MKIEFIKSKTVVNLAQTYLNLCQLSHKMLKLAFDCSMDKKFALYNILKNISKQFVTNASQIFDLITNDCEYNIENIQINTNFSFKKGCNFAQSLQFLAEECKNLAVSVLPEFSLVAKSEKFDELSKKFTFISDALYENWKTLNGLNQKISQNKLYKCEQVTTQCCLNCGYTDKKKCAPKKCPNCNANQNYFDIKL